MSHDEAECEANNLRKMIESGKVDNYEEAEKELEFFKHLYEKSIAYPALPELTADYVAWSQLSFSEQDLKIDREFYDRIRQSPEVDVFRQKFDNNPIATIKEMGRFVAALTPSDNWQEWLKHATEKMPISEAARQKMCLCFHRAIAFQLMAEAVGKDKIQSAVMEGEWRTSEKSEFHVYNQARMPSDSKIYIIDSAFLDSDGSPLVFDITDQLDKGKDHTRKVKLVDGTERIYKGDLPAYYP